MGEISRYLFLAAAVPYLVLGSLHAWATPLHPHQRRGLTPRDPRLVEVMTHAVLRVTDRTDLWKAWVGFNLSHSLGVVLLGVVVLLVGLSPERFARDAAVFVPLAALAAAVYLAIGLRYWFRIPITGCAVSLALLLASWALRAFGP